MITKIDIEKLKDEILEFAKKYDLGKDFFVLCNGNMYGYELTKRKGSEYRYYYRKVNKKGINPLDYCEYYPEKFILGLAYDGRFYEMMDGELGYGIYDKFMEIFKKYGLYVEHSDSCHAAAYPSGDDIEEYEYTEFKKEKIINVYNSKMAPDTAFATIIQLWYELSARNGDEGSCVIGAKLELKYKGNKYRVNAQSPYQGSVSWERPLEVIKKCFEYIGCEDMVYMPGRMD